jgi:hypothetical protein
MNAPSAQKGSSIGKNGQRKAKHKALPPLQIILRDRPLVSKEQILAIFN